MEDRKVLLSGYFGFGNCGDEIILNVEKELLEQFGYRVSFISASPGSQNKISRNLLKTITAIKHSDIIVSGGGGIIQDKTSVKSLLYYLFVLFIGRFFGKKTVCFAQGIGPLNTKFGKFVTNKILSNADLITVRDNYSLDILRSCGIRKQVNVCADVAFLFSKEKKMRLPYEKYVIFSPGYALSMPSKETLSEITKIISEKSKLPVIIMPLYPGRDFNVANEVAKKTGFPLLIFNEIGQCLYVFGKSEFVVGMRYHSVVLSALSKKAFVSMVYDPKVRAISEEFGIKFIEDYGKMTKEQFSEVFAFNFLHRDEIEHAIEIKTAELKKRAGKNFEIFKEKFCS